MVTTRSGVAPCSIAFVMLAVAGSIGVAISVVRMHCPLLQAVVATVNTGVTIVVAFAMLYYDSGSAENFGHPLSRLDAIYVAIGTLTTAGSGNLEATSELARGLLTGQMILDLAFVGVAVTLLVTRIAERR